MTTFWIIAAALVVIALLTVALPLLTGKGKSDAGATRTELNVSVFRDQLAELSEDRRSGRLGDDQYEKSRSELERRLLEDVPDADAPVLPRTPLAAQAVAIAVGVAVPLLAVPMYLWLGNPALLSPQQQAGAHGVGPQQIEEMIGRLAARLEQKPNDGDGWITLARSCAALGRFGEANSAFAKAVAILPEHPQLLADYADTLAMARGGRLGGEPEKLIERALRADPNNRKALALAGSVAFENKDFVGAADHWERLQRLIPSGSEFANSVGASIAKAKSLAGTRVNERAAAPGEGRAP